MNNEQDIDTTQEHIDYELAKLSIGETIADTQDDINRETVRQFQLKREPGNPDEAAERNSEAAFKATESLQRPAGTTAKLGKDVLRFI